MDALNYKDSSGSWQPVDNTLVVDAAGIAHNPANRYTLDLPSDASGVFGFRTEQGSSVTWAVAGAPDASRTISGSTATYALSADRSLQVTATGNSVEDDMVLADATADPTVTELLTTSTGLSPAMRPDGSIGLKDPTNQGLQIAPPRVLDATLRPAPESAVNVNLTPSATSGQYTLTIGVSSSWLNTPGRLFPVTIDPTYTFGPEGNDELQPLDCSVTYYLTTPSCYSGNWMSFGYLAASGVVHSLLQYSDISSEIPSSASVTSASLSGTSYALIETQTQTPVEGDLEQVTSPWNRQTTWTATGVNGGLWNTPGGDFSVDTAASISVTSTNPRGQQGVTFTGSGLTNIIQGWVSNPTTDDGLLFKSTIEAGDYDAALALQNIELSVTWTGYVPTLVPNGGTATATSGTSLSLSLTSAPTAGDLTLAYLSGHLQSWQAPTGWVVESSTSDTNDDLAIAYHIANPFESGSYTFQQSGSGSSDVSSGRIEEWTGFGLSPYVDVFGNAQSSGPVMTMSLNAGTTSSAPELVVAAVGASSGGTGPVTFSQNLQTQMSDLDGLASAASVLPTDTALSPVTASWSLSSLPANMMVLSFVGATSSPFGACTWWYSLATGNHYLCDAIETKYEQLGGPGGLNGTLGYPTSSQGVTGCSGGGQIAYFQTSGYEDAIAWSLSTGAHEVNGLIANEYYSAGSMCNFLGYPATDELETTPKAGRYEQFGGSAPGYDDRIYYQPGATAAFEVHGVISQEYAKLGFENSVLGFPTTNETETQVCPDGTSRGGRYNNFQPATGSDTGSRAIVYDNGTAALSTGEIRELWASEDYECGTAGFPVGDPYACYDRLTSCQSYSLAGTTIYSNEYAALGDSYQSGEGTGGEGSGYYISPSNTDGCHRSTIAYPPLVTSELYETIYGQQLGTGLTFAACSGATTADLSSGLHSEPPQFQELDGSERLVTIGVGGDDAGFASVLENCIEIDKNGLGGPCENDTYPGTNETFDAYVDGEIDALPASLASVYQTIKALSPLARVLAVGYPHLFVDFPELSCGGIDASDQYWMNQKADMLDSVIQAAATAAGIEFIDTREYFDGYGECTPDQWFNGIVVPFAGSFHPNQNGQVSLATVVLGDQPPLTP